MKNFQSETLGQGNALRRLASNYGGTHPGVPLGEVPRPKRVLLTGMGASFHAASWGAAVLCRRGIRAMAVESSELMYFSRILLEDTDLVVFVSQSGASAEIEPLLRDSISHERLVAITNEPGSHLGRSAKYLLPLFAGTERTVATMTYLNSLACLWLLARAWSPDEVAGEDDVLKKLAGEVDKLLTGSEALLEPWHRSLGQVERIYFLGHGPHASTARQAAMMMSEVVKRPAIGTGIGDFRHGLIEAADERAGVVVFGGGGATDASVRRLVSDLRSYGCSVLSIVEGRAESLGRPRVFDEMLGSLLDIVPAQQFVAATAQRLHVDTSFRHISKVIERL